MEDAGTQIHVPDHIVVLRWSVVIRQMGEIAESSLYECQAEAPPEHWIEPRHGHEQPTRVYLRDVRIIPRISLGIYAEGARRPRCQPLYRLAAELHDLRLPNCFRERRKRGHAARDIVDPEVSEALVRIGDEHPPMLPYRLTEDLASRQVFG